MWTLRDSVLPAGAQGKAEWLQHKDSFHHTGLGESRSKTQRSRYYSRSDFDFPPHKYFVNTHGVFRELASHIQPGLKRQPLITSQELLE